MIFRHHLETDQRNQMIDITREVSASVAESGVQSGICIIHIPHTTAAVTINENCDSDVQSDMLSFLSEKIPKSSSFHHMEGNSDSHIKSSLFGCSQTVIIERGQLLLGTWQGIYFCEFDGPRKRSFVVKIIADQR